MNFYFSLARGKNYFRLALTFFMRVCQLKEEEAANSSILTAIKTSGEAILQDIRNLKVTFCFFSEGPAT
jgi:hypothetical protein